MSPSPLDIGLHGTTPHILDLVISNEEGMVQDISYHPGLGLSDHVCISFAVACVTDSVSIKNPKFDLNHANYAGMRESLESVDWHKEISSLRVVDAWNYFYDVFDNILKCNIPIFRTSSKKNIYMTCEARKLKNKKYCLWRKYCLSHAQSDHDAYVYIRNKLRSLTRTLRRNFEQSITANIQNNPKAFWRYAKSRLKTQTRMHDIHDSDGNIIESDVSKATAFIQFFTSVFTHEDCSNLPSFSIGHSVSSLCDIDISPSVIYNKLRLLNGSKSPGPDGWSPVALKETAAEISVPLSIIFTKSLQSGVLPDSWKTANVVPIHKSGSRHLPNNYRPISLTSTVVKLLESIVRDSILGHLTDNNLVSDR